MPPGLAGLAFRHAAPLGKLRLFAVMGLSTASFTLTWACAKEVNPPLLSGMSTRWPTWGFRRRHPPALVGWVMDQRWQGALANGARVYSPEDFRYGLFSSPAPPGSGRLRLARRETRCRNIWQAG